jgi:hypothetical protein
MTTMRAAITVVALVIALPLRAAAQDPRRDSVVAPVAPVVHADSAYRPEELRGYLLGLVGPMPLVRSVALAGFDQWRGRPSAFPPNWRGFTDRLGSRFAQVAISHTLRFGLSRAFDQRTIRYEPCACGDSISRVAYALIAPMRVNTPNGRRLSVMYPLTEIASGILVTGARSDGLHVGDGVRNGITGVAAESAISLLREFWPWRWRPPML